MTIQVKNTAYTANLENMGYMLDLLERGYIPEQNEIPELTEEKYLSFKEELTAKGIPIDLTFEMAKEKYREKVIERYQRGIPLEKAYRNAIQQNREAIVHVNNFDSTYTSQHGLDNISFSPKLGKKRFSECTDPLRTTIMGTGIWLEKIANFFKQDPNHTGLWTLTVSYPENIPLAIQVILDYCDIQVIKSTYCINNNIEAVAMHIFTQLHQNKNWLNKQPLETVRNNGTYDDKLRIQRNKKTAKHNRKVDKRKLTVQNLKNSKTYKQLKQAINNLLNTKTSKHLNLILGRIRTTNQTNKKATNKTSKGQRKRRKSLCLYIQENRREASYFLSICGCLFFSSINGLQARVKNRDC